MQIAPPNADVVVAGDFFNCIKIPNSNIKDKISGEGVLKELSMKPY